MVSVNCRTVIYFILAFPLSFLTVNNSVIGSGCIMLLLIFIKVNALPTTGAHFPGNRQLSLILNDG